MSHPSGAAGTGWACPALLQASFFLLATASQAGGLGTLPLLDDQEAALPAPTAAAMAEALSCTLAAPFATPRALLQAGTALQAVLECPYLPLCPPAALFGAAYVPAFAALPPPALVALVLACDMAALAQPLRTLAAACLAQRYASQPAAAFAAQVASLSPRAAALAKQWWAAAFACPQLQWWKSAYGVPADCAAWAASSLPYYPTSTRCLPPVAFGLEADSPPEERWARGLEPLPGQPSPPTHAVLLALAFEQEAWLQRHHPGHLCAAGMRLGRVCAEEDGSALDSVQELLCGDGKGAQARVGRGGDAYELLFCSGMAWYMGEQEFLSPQHETESCAAALAGALSRHQGDAGAALVGFEALISMDKGCQLGERRALQLQPVLAALRTHAGNAMLCGTLCKAVEQLARQPARTACAAAGAVQAVAGTLAGRPEDARLALHACNALLELARVEGSAEAVPAVLAALQAQARNPVVAIAACQALQCMASWEGGGGAALAAGSEAVLLEVLSCAPAGSWCAITAAAALQCVLRPCGQWEEEVGLGLPLPPRCLATGVSGAALRVWTLGAALRVWTLGAEESSARELQLPGDTPRVLCLCALEEGRLASGGDEDGSVRVWQAASGVCERVLQGHTALVNGVCALTGGGVVSGSSDGTLRVWSVATGECLQQLQVGASVQCLCALPEGCVAAGSGATVQVWQAERGERLRVLKEHFSSVASVCALPGGRLVSGTSDGVVWVWDVATGHHQRVLPGHKLEVAGVCALGGGHVVSASHDHTLRVWEVASGACLRVLEGHEGALLGVCALGGGAVASAAEDGTVRVWQVQLGVCTRVLGGAGSGTSCVCAL